MNPEYFLTKNEVASRLRISTRTLEHLMASGSIPFLKLRRTVRFSPRIFDRIADPVESEFPR